MNLLLQKSKWSTTLNPTQTAAFKCSSQIDKKVCSRKQDRPHCRAVALYWVGFTFVHIIKWKLNRRRGYGELNWLLTDFLGLGVDREEAGMFDLFLKNILKVAESKFSTAKHLHDVWRTVKMHTYWLGRTHLMQARLHERTVSIIRLGHPTVFPRLDRGAPVKCKVPEWDRQQQGSVYWSASAVASAAPSGRSLSPRFPVNNSTEELPLIMLF